MLCIARIGRYAVVPRKVTVAETRRLFSSSRTKNAGGGVTKTDGSGGGTSDSSGNSSSSGAGTDTAAKGSANCSVRAPPARPRADRSDRTREIGGQASGQSPGKLPSLATLGGSSVRSVIVPRVQPTDHIGADTIHTEGLFAGYRPLFLGNSSLPSGSGDFNGYTEHRMDSFESEGKPVIPWDASISGLLYKDNAFGKLSKDIVHRLRPFKVDSEKLGGLPAAEKPQLIVMKVHNTKINDESELVDLFNVKHTKKYRQHHHNELSKQNLTVLERQKRLTTVKNYQIALQKLAFNYKFIRDDQIALRNVIKKLNRHFSLKFEEMSGLTVQNESRESFLPIYIYFQTSIVSKRLFKRFLRNKIDFHTSPLISTIFANLKADQEKVTFEGETGQLLTKRVNSLAEHIPSLVFVDIMRSTECLIHPGPVPGFKKMYWLNQRKRRATFGRHKRDKDYVFSISRDQVVSRNGSRCMSHPVNIYWKDTTQAFREWEYYN